jgi:hypothetical protein
LPLRLWAGVAGVATLAAAGGCDGADREPCQFTVSTNAVSAKIPTVGVVEWSLAGTPPSSAKIVFALKDAESALLNRGGEAPVSLSRASYRTLLLGLKPQRDYTFHIEAVRDGQTCVSAEYALPTTGSLASAQRMTVNVSQPAKREPGFIVTSSGSTLPSSAFIIDADGDVVWSFDAPESVPRALMDYEGDNMWMLALNLLNEGGEMRVVSMDGEREQREVPGLENAHHDFSVMPGGKVAVLAWSAPGNDPESDLLIRSPDGTVNKAFTIGSNLYQSDTFHANAVHYLPFADGFTIADRNPNVLVKVSATGVLDWQIGGTCDAAPAGDRCAARNWFVVHGHHLREDGTFLAFNNGYAAPPHVFQFQVNATPTAFTAAAVSDYMGDTVTNTMGDVQRLPGGNTLITYSGDGKIVELDSSWSVVQTFTLRVGYSSWRPTLYGPPARP